MTMAFFSIKPSLLLISCFVLLFLLFASSSNALNKVVDVNVICKQTANPSFCSNLLNSRPGGAKGADLTTFAQYTIDIVRGNVTEALTLIKLLIAQSGKDSKAKAHYEQCLFYYDGDDDSDGALGNILYMQELLKKGDYVGVAITANAVTTNVGDCASEDDPSVDKSKLPKYNDYIIKVANIINTIGSLFRA